MARIDEKYIENLQNFTSSLENIVELMKTQQKEQSTTTDVIDQFLKNFDAAKISKIVEDLEVINKNSKSTLSNTEKILAEVKAIKAQKESGGFGSIADPANKNKILDGVKIITMIAGGVLAIGMAFKLISPVDIASVLVLGVAIAAMSYSFAKIIAIPELTFKNVLLATITLPMMAAGIMISSWLLSAVRVVSPMQLLSIVGISIGLGLAASHIIKAAHNIKIADIGKYMLLPIVFVAMSAAIVASSYILSGIAPITFGVFISVLGYAILLIPMAYAFGILISLIGGKSQKMGGVDSKLASFMGGGGISITDMLKASLIIPLVAGVLVASSYILSGVAPITANIFLSVLGYSIALIPMVFVFTVVALMVGKGMKGFMGLPIETNAITYADILKTSIIVLAVALTFVGVSVILQAFQPLEDPLGLVIAVTAIGFSVVIGGLALWALSKLGGPGVMLQGAIAALIISGTIMLASYILSVGTYDTYPSLEWAAGVGASLFIFGVMMAATGMALVASLGIGYAVLAAGASAMLIIAATLVASGEIIGTGQWNTWQYPSSEWAMGVGGSIYLFAKAMAIISMIEGLNSLFGGKNTDFSQFVIDTSTTMVLSGMIIGMIPWASLSHPTKEWAEGVGGAILLFAQAMVQISLIEGFSSLLGNKKDFNQFVIETSKTMVLAGMIIAKGDWGKKDSHPSKEWAEGVGGSILMFAQAMGEITKMGMLSSIIGGKQQDLQHFMVYTAQSLILIGRLFNKEGMVFDLNKIPSAEWGKRIGSTLKNFIEMLAAMNSATSFTSNISESIASIVNMAKGIILVGYQFALNNKDGKLFDPNLLPGDVWSKSISNALKALTNKEGISSLNDFISALERVKELGDIQNPILMLSLSINRLSLSMENFSIAGMKKLSSLAQAFTMLGLIDQVKLSSVIKTIEDRKAKVDSIADDKGFMSGFLESMGNSSRPPGSQVSGPTVKGTSVAKDTDMSKLVSLVEMIQKDVNSLATKETITEETSSVSSPSDVRFPGMS